MKHILIILLLTSSLTACGQSHQHQNSPVMDTSKLTHPIAKAAFDAWQQGNSAAWLSHFTANPKLLDDGHPRDFKKFSTEVIGTERFLSIDKVEDNGKSIYGKFHSDTWGDFKTYFKFHIDSTNKIYQLEIGQADY